MALGRKTQLTTQSIKQREYRREYVPSTAAIGGAAPASSPAVCARPLEGELEIPPKVPTALLPATQNNPIDAITTKIRDRAAKLSGEAIGVVRRDGDAVERKYRTVLASSADLS
ncbi:tyrosine--tRNA ligase [Striga asiatica]|uniref:Tyrosine--tRNA ligase n=1 Tax=Striga asiatica TaxID=4170 RepID=A0A5A7RDC9_STRAF|nr:tyrosine--tRNA ligase [Striga asiatica]